MAGEVKSQLEIRLTGGVGAGGGAGSPSGISRGPQLGPGQAMANFDAQRRERFRREIAAELANDQSAMNEVHRGLERLQFERMTEVASARRARQSFVDRVRSSRAAQGYGADPMFLSDRGAAALSRRASTAAKQQIKGGLKAGFGGLAVGMLSESLPNSGGFSGAAGRIAGSTAAGAAMGSIVPGVGTAVGAAYGFISSAISEVKGYITDLYEMGSKLKEEIEKSKKDTKKFLDEQRQMLKDGEDELRELLEEGKEEIARDMMHATYRATRYVHVNLTGRS